MDINTFSVKLDWLQNKSFPSLSYEAPQLQEQREDSVTDQKQCVSQLNFFMMIDPLTKTLINCYLYEMHFIIKWYNVISIYNFITQGNN